MDFSHLFLLPKLAQKRYFNYSYNGHHLMVKELMCQKLEM